MDRRPAMDGLATLRARIRRLLPSRVERAALELYDRARGRLRHARADVFVVSYPKAGRTWLRFLIGHALAAHYAIDERRPSELDRLRDADRRVPRIVFTHDGMMPGAHPGDVRRDHARYRNRDVILLVRDPRDLVVSDHHHLRHRMGRDVPDLDAFVRGAASGFETVLAFHHAWRDSRDVPRRLLLVRYEDLRADPAGELRRVLGFLGLDAVSEATIAHAVAAGSFERMRALESSGAHGAGDLGGPRADAEEGRKVRRGRIGGYRDELEDGTIAWLDARLAQAGLESFGYR